MAVSLVFIFKPDSELTISIVGDIMLSRGAESYLQEYGYDYPYKNVREIFLGDDLTIGNLECPITSNDNAAEKAKRFIFKADDENASALKKAGFDCLNLANNHSMDYLSEGLLDTMINLENNQLSFVGASKDSSENGSFMFRKNGITVGLLAYSALPPEGFFYNNDKPTIKYIGTADFSKLEADIASLDCDFLIVYFHWGTEYEAYNSSTQETIAKAAIDFGADFVVGSHPHILQNVEVYKDKYIYYSLGNFIFDKQPQPGTDEGIILQIKINKKGLLGVNEIPIKIIDARPIISL